MREIDKQNQNNETQDTNIIILLLEDDDEATNDNVQSFASSVLVPTTTTTSLRSNHLRSITTMSNTNNNNIRCHYDVLGVAQDADSSTIKKAHRKLALKHHPDKNHGDDGAAADQFRLVQQAYEVLSDAQERKWYDDHRDGILAGWSTGGGGDDDNAAAASAMLFEVVHYMHPGCYSGYHDEKGGFYNVYTGVFENIVQCERRQSQVSIELPTEFGNSETDWSSVQLFYQTWESFASQLNFAWEDKYNVHEDAPNRRVRRLMEEDNKKARRNAKKTYNGDILALVAFVKRRDPRVKAKQQELEKQKEELALKQKQEAAERKHENKKAKEAWREQAQREMEDLEEADRLAGRVRLADLDDDYDYGGGKKRGKKKKNKRRAQEEEQEKEDVQKDVQYDANGEVVIDAPGAKPEDPCDSGGGDDDEINEKETEGTCIEKASEAEEIEMHEAASDQESVEVEVEVLPEDIPDGSFSVVEQEEFSESEDDEPDVWRCECCRKDFKSEGQMTNHMKSKKHKENFKKYHAKMKREEEEIMAQMLDEVDLGS